MHIMRVSKPLKEKRLRIAVSVGIILLAFSLSLSLLHIFYPHTVNVPISSVGKNDAFKIDTTQESVEYLEPRRIEVPRISINTLVVDVGLTQDNDMDISDDSDRAAWYKLGPKPGEVGSAVIAGHYGWKDGKKSAFHDLRELQVGDTIIVHDEKGVKLTFIVRETRTYPLDADTTEVFRSSDKKAHLNLITCDGYWNNSLQTYADRLVIFSDLNEV